MIQTDKIISKFKKRETDLLLKALTSIGVAKYYVIPVYLNYHEFCTATYDRDERRFVCLCYIDQFNQLHNIKL